MKPAGKGPSERAYHAACYDPKRKGMWLHGGFRGAFYDDLWFFDSTKNVWKQIMVKGPLGSQTLVAGRMVHVPGSGQRLVNSGSDSNTSWWYDIAGDTWTTATQADAPEGRSYHGMCFDPKGRRMYVLGGTRGGFTGKCVAGNLWAASLGAGKPAGTSSGQ